MMTIEDIEQKNSLVDALSSLSNTTIESIDEVALASVSGGDINRAHIVTMPDDRQFFLKRNDLDNFALLKSEVVGLQAIANTGANTCQPLALGRDDTLGFSFLILSMLYTDRPNQSAITKENWADLAQQLVTLHKAIPPQPDSQLDQQLKQPSNGKVGKQTKQLQQPQQQWQAGWFEDNFIGFTPQYNTWLTDWHEFFASQRLQPQIKLAFDNGYLDKQILLQLKNIQQKLKNYLPNYSIKQSTIKYGSVTGENSTRPSLLHGDLWAGNALFGSNDKQGDNLQGYLIDPAVYVGHPETDIAMTRLFGGFDPHFYEVYTEQLPIEPNFAERQDIYNLYHYLNHLNLFGVSYLKAVVRIAKHFG